MDYALDPELVPVAAAVPDIDLSDIVNAREVAKAMRLQTPQFVPPASLLIERKTVPGPPGDPDVDVCLIAPRERATPAPALYWIHGGGFVLGDVDSDLEDPADIARTLGVVVASVEYRLAPEHPFPAAVEDCFAGLKWFAEHASDLGIDSARLAIGGCSAGAGLAAAVALLARDRKGPALCFQLLDIPEVDDRLETGSINAYTDTPGWNRHNAILSWQAYLGPHHRGSTSPYAAPARAADLTGLPPAYVITCEFDPLRDEGIEYACRMMAAGVPTELHHYPGTFHGSCGAGRGTTISNRMIKERNEALARCFTPR